MKFIHLPLPDARLIVPEPFVDARGKFVRLFCRGEFDFLGKDKHVVQVNHSITLRQGAVRGMHFQRFPKAEIKIIKCIRGAIFDVIVDLRSNSPKFLSWHGEELSSENMKIMYVPEGFAHGFQALEDNVEIIYLNTEYYNPEYEKGVRYDDPLIGISWPIGVTEVSQKDSLHPLLTEDIAKGIFGT